MSHQATLTLIVSDAPHFANESNNDNRFDFALPRITDDEAFFEFCQRNPLLHWERNENGEITLMAPGGWETGHVNSDIVADLVIWNRQQGEPGFVADSSTGYRLPNNHDRSPDASWTRRDRIEALTQQQRERFAPLCPDFVVELLSPIDSLSETQKKLEEWIENGAQLGFLIDRKNRTIYVYRPNQPTQTLVDPTEVSADPELPGFVLQTRRIF